MAAISFARRVTANIFKASIKDHSYADSATTFSKACSSTAFKREQFVADTAKEGLRKATHVADTVSDASKKTTDGAWDAAKEANQQIRDGIVENDDDDDNSNSGDQAIDEVHKLEGPVDTAEFRSMEEDMKMKPEDQEED